MEDSPIADCRTGALPQIFSATIRAQLHACRVQRAAQFGRCKHTHGAAPLACGAAKPMGLKSPRSERGIPDGRGPRICGLAGKTCAQKTSRHSMQKHNQGGGYLTCMTTDSPFISNTSKRTLMHWRCGWTTSFREGCKRQSVTDGRPRSSATCQ